MNNYYDAEKHEELIKVAEKLKIEKDKLAEEAMSLHTALMEHEEWFTNLGEQYVSESRLQLERQLALFRSIDARYRIVVDEINDYENFNTFGGWEKERLLNDKEALLEEVKTNGANSARRKLGLLDDNN